MTEVSHPEQKTLHHYRWPWPEAVVPPDMPVWSYVELDLSTGVASRWVQLFADGRIERDSIEIEERKGDSCPSLWEEVVTLQQVEAEGAEPVAAADFEAIWQRGTDTPFWFPDGYPKPSFIA